MMKLLLDFLMGLFTALEIFAPILGGLCIFTVTHALDKAKADRLTRLRGLALLLCAAACAGNPLETIAETIRSFTLSAECVGEALGLVLCAVTLVFLAGEFNRWDKRTSG